jgi:hypothetical protein
LRRSLASGLGRYLGRSRLRLRPFGHMRCYGRSGMAVLAAGTWRGRRRWRSLRRAPARSGQGVARRWTGLIGGRPGPRLLRRRRGRLLPLLLGRLWTQRRRVRHGGLRRARWRGWRALRRRAQRLLGCRRLRRRLAAATVAAGRLIGRVHRRAPPFMRAGLLQAEDSGRTCSQISPALPISFIATHLAPGSTGPRMKAIMAKGWTPPLPTPSATALTKERQPRNAAATTPGGRSATHWYRRNRTSSTAPH